MKTREELNNQILRALDLIGQFSDVDGRHHRQWLLDQVVTVLTGDDDEYRRFVEEYNAQGHTVDWSEGIAP
jgi:hypothetical protein